MLVSLAAAKSVDRDSDAERIEVWDIARGQQIAHLTGHTNGVRRISFSPCSRFLASGGQADRTVRVWEVENGQLNQNVEYGSGSILPSYSPEGALRVVADATDAGSMNPWNAATVTVWDVDSGEKCYSSRCAQNCTITFSNGSHLAYQSGREVIEVWCFGKPPHAKLFPRISRSQIRCCFRTMGKLWQLSIAQTVDSIRTATSSYGMSPRGKPERQLKRNGRFSMCTRRLMENATFQASTETALNSGKSAMENRRT